MPICDRSYAGGGFALPDQATFLIENTVFGEGLTIEANHHCGDGNTGILCFPTYMLHNIRWRNTGMFRPWIWFQHDQQGNPVQNYGGVFTLSPPDAQHVMNGGEVEDPVFPSGFVSLVENRFQCKWWH